MHPSHFLTRLQLLEPADTWAGLEKSAEVRYYEGVDLLARGWTTGSIYLLGYVAESLLKAATFRALGIPSARPLGKSTTVSAGAGVTVATVIVKLDHNLPRLRDQLYTARRASGNPMALDVWAGLYPRVDGLTQNWTEVLRYRSTDATLAEAQAVLRRVDWIITNYLHL